MIKLILFAYLLTVSTAQAVHYNNYDINNKLSNSHINKISSDYINQYFSSPKPNDVVAGLLKANMSPLEREYILNNLLTEISQQPPQAFFQDFVDGMKSYQVQATRTAEEGHIPVPVFSINSKAHGIENIWTTYRTEQQFHQLFKTNLPLAIGSIQQIMTLDTKQRRPQWLGVKNSLSVMPETVLAQLSNHLINTSKANQGLDILISHVGLITGNVDLINKALLSEQAQVRQTTLRKLHSHLPTDAVKTILMNTAQVGADRKFSTSLLSQYSNDKTVEDFLISQLNDQQTANNAAFALSQSKSSGLAQSLKNHYLNTGDKSIKNQVLLALKLNNSPEAKLVLDDLRQHTDKDTSAKTWLQSFDTQNSGEQQ